MNFVYITHLLKSFEFTEFELFSTHVIELI